MVLPNHIAHNEQLLRLNSEDELRYSLIKTWQNQFQSTDLLADEEARIYQKMRVNFDRHAIRYNPRELFFPLRSFSRKDMDVERFQSLISQPVVPPFVLKNWLADAPALTRWSLDFFAKHTPEVPVSYYHRQEGGLFEDALRAPMLEVIQRMRAASAADVYYIQNTSDVFKQHRELLADMQFERLKGLFANKAHCAILQLFMGGAKTGVDLHCANEFNAFVMVAGKKEWTFIDPAFTYALRATLSANALNAMTAIKGMGHSIESLEAQHPLYNRLIKWQVTLEPGDVLVFSPWWWHGVINSSDFSLAVATRWTTLEHDFFPRGNVTFQNIQRSNPDFQSYSRQYLLHLLNDELIGDETLRRTTFGKPYG